MGGSNQPNDGTALDELVAQARGLGRAAFVQRYAAGFLVRPPSPMPASVTPARDNDDEFDDGEGTVRLGFKTGLVAREDLAVDLVGENVVDPSSWYVVPVAKREGNPYPERIGIGRTRNCDIVIRWPRVSKLHAHLHLENGAVVRVTDCSSANGTFVDGRPVEASGALCGLGSRLRLGDFEVELKRAEDLVGLLSSL